MIRTLALGALALQLAGCASIDTINGVRMNASTAPDATYCDRNPAVCILLGAGAIGGLGAIFLANRDHHHTPVPAPAAPPAPKPPCATVSADNAAATCRPPV